MLTEKELKTQMWPVITTETLLRKWERRLLVALTLDEKQRCIYHIKLYGGMEKT